MAARYWRGGSGSWSAINTANWSTTSNGPGGASVPLPADDVYFDQTGPYTVTLTNAAQCQSFNLTASNVTFACGAQNLSINGAVFTINSTTTWSGTGNIIFANTAVLCTATTNGITLTNTQFQVNGAGGVILGSALTMSATSQINMQTGTLNINGFSCSVGTWSNSGTAVRGMNWGTNGSITLTNTTAAASVLVGATMTNFTLSGTGGFFSNANTTKTYSWGSTGGSAAIAVNLTLTGGGASLQSINATSWFNDLNVSGVSCAYNASGLTITGTLTLSATSAYTTTSFIVNATTTGAKIVQNAATAPFGLNVNIPGGTWTPNATISNIGTLTLTAGTLDASVYDLTCNAFDSTNTNTRSVSFGSRNIYLLGTTGGLTIPTMAGWSWTGTGGFSVDMTSTRSISLGSTSGGSYTPGVAPNVTISGGAALITMTSTSLLPAWVNKLDYGGHNATSNASFVNIVTSLTGPSNGNATTLRNVTFNFGNTNGGTQTIKSNGAAIGAIQQFGGTNIVSCLDALNMTMVSISGTYLLTSGTLQLNGFSHIIPIFSSSNANTRSIDFGTGGTITTNHTTAGTVCLTMVIMTNFTWTGTGAACGFYYPMTTTRSASVGSSSGATTANAFNLFVSGSTLNGITITTGSWFNTLDFTGAGFNGQTVSATTVNVTNCVLAGSLATNLTLTMVATGTLRFNGATNLAALTINHTGTTTLQDAGAVIVANTNGVTLTSGTFDLNGFTFTAGVFHSNNTNTRSLKFTSGSTMTLNYTGTTGTNILDVADATNLTITGTGGFTVNAMTLTRTFTFGSTAGGSSSNSPNLTFSTGASVPTLTSGSWFNNLDFGTTTSTIPATSLNLNGLTLSTGGTYTNLAPTFVGTGSINTNGKSLTTIIINNPSGTLTLASAVTSTTSTTLTSGALALAGFTLTPTQFISGIAATRAISGAGTGTISLSNDWTVTDGTGFTGSDYIINMSKATAKTFAGAGGSYGILVQAGAGALTISGSNTLADIQATTRPSTISFTAGTTQTLGAFTLAGTLGNLVTINSTTSGTQFTMSRATGTINASYLSIQDSNVTGGATWYNNNGTNTVLSNNTGWNGAVTSPVKGQFFSFF